MKGAFEQLLSTSYLGGGSAAFIEALYESYLDDASAVPSEWRDYFQTLEQLYPRTSREVVHSNVRAEFAELVRGRRAGHTQPGGGLSPQDAEKQAAVLRLINAWRVRGHQRSQIDPLNLRPPPDIPDLDPAFHQLGTADMQTEFNTGSLFTADRMKLQDIVAFLRDTYGGTVGSEFMHITDTTEKRWIQERLERPRGRPDLPAQHQRAVLERLTAAEGIEKYLHSRYVGQKRFSLEGGESMIPLLDELIQVAGQHGIKEMVLGMAHRGRLNVLINILGKSPADLFQEFEGNFNLENAGSGDVKYHLGYSSDIDTPGGPLHLALAFNPSHLEIVNPVVEGSVRARMVRRHDDEGKQVLPVLIHGDAAFAGQGVVMEAFQFSQARGFYTGGTVHVVLNNQIGFTTSNPLDARSTFHCTEVAKMVQAPIFHVNGDDPDAVLFVTRLAMEYRNTFHKDVVIDLVCYRRHGHNEADEPAATQPMMYAKIKQRPTTRQLYAERLQSLGVASAEDAAAMASAYRDALDAGSVVAPSILVGLSHPFVANWRRYVGADKSVVVDTGVPLTRIRELADRLQTLPSGFELNPRVAGIYEGRRKMGAGALQMDWGFAETMAYATLLEQGYSVRLTGQDSGRGTFSHRHCVLHNALDGSTYVPLSSISDQASGFVVIDSLLSEEAVLGFEYGYSTNDPETLVIWEGQFGDFVNGAQVVIDQFISSGETKWGRFSGLTMYLPHGYEGQGPEHSSARLERFLQLCADHNMEVCIPTTPAQFFHMIRRQMLRQYRKPLIVFTPKSLLRHKLSTSNLDDLAEGTRWQEIIDDIDDIKPKDVERVVLCSGKVYFDLLQARRKQELTNTAIVRIEQPYPFPENELAQLLRRRYNRAERVVWCQEEPKNQGAWYSTQHHLRNALKPGQELFYAGRDASASPAVGYPKLHHEQQRQLVEAALTL